MGVSLDIPACLCLTRLPHTILAELISTIRNSIFVTANGLILANSLAPCLSYVRN